MLENVMLRYRMLCSVIECYDPLFHVMFLIECYGLGIWLCKCKDSEGVELAGEGEGDGDVDRQDG